MKVSMEERNQEEDGNLRQQPNEIISESSVKRLNICLHALDRGV